MSNPSHAGSPAVPNDAGAQESQRMLANLLRNLAGMAYRCRNDPQWTMEFVSEGCFHLTGYAADDLLQNRRLSFEELIHPDDRRGVRDDVDRALVAGERFVLNYRIRAADGTERWVLEHGLGLGAAGQRPEFLEGIITDITKQKEAERALVAKEAMLAAIIDHSFEFIGLLDLDGRMLRANETALNSVGAKFSDVAGTFFWDAPWWKHSEPERTRLQQAIARAARGGFIRYETTHVAKDGRVLEIDFSLKPVFDESGRVTMIIPEGRDITDRKVSERTQKESEELFSKAFRASPDMITISDFETSRYIEANPAQEKISGYPRSELIGRSPVELGMIVDFPRFQALRAELIERGSFSNVEAPSRSRNGDILTLMISAELIELGGRRCVLRVSRDITHQRAAQQALRESEEKFSKAFRASAYSLTLSDLATGRYLEVNAGFERISGFSREEVVGKTASELNFWRNPAVRAEFIRQLELDGRVRGMEVSFTHRDGSEVIGRCSAEILEIGGRRCILNTVEDITEQRRSERVKVELEAQLRQAQKLEALGQLAGGIAHDFNNILTALLAYTELAILDATEPSMVREHLSEVRKAGIRAKDLVRQILTFSRQEDRERRPIRLDRVVDEAVTLLRSTLRKNLELHVSLDPHTPTVLADPTQIHQIVMNLCTNAAHAIAANPGKISLSLTTAVIEQSGPIGGSSRSHQSRFARLAVSDTGHGMSDEVLKHIFEPFFTTKGPGEGTGLGLAVVRGIVEEHDGLISVRSRVGEGTTFEVLLPEFTVLDAESGGSAKIATEGRGERILFVDDERMICELVSKLLGRLGYNVTTRSDPAAALEVFRADPDAFDVVITDLTMPRMTGIEVAREMLALRPGLPILLSSGFSGTWTPDNVRAVGLRGLIPKPLTSSILITALRGALADREPRDNAP